MNNAIAESVEITKAELIQAKRAVLVMREMSNLALSMAPKAAKAAPVELLLDQQVLVKLLKKLDAIAK